MRVVCCFLSVEEFEQVDGDDDYRPGDPVKVMPDCENKRLLILMRSGTDEDTLASELTWKITQEGRKSWMYAGDALRAVG